MNVSVESIEEVLLRKQTKHIMLDALKMLINNQGKKMKDFFTLDNSYITNLIENGFVKLKSMKNLNLDDFAHEIEKEIGNSTFSTSSKSHIKLLKNLNWKKLLHHFCLRLLRKSIIIKDLIIISTMLLGWCVQET